jgi:uncharacterized protein with WD repeat
MDKQKERIMDFVDKSIRYDDGSANLMWISGIYQISAYEHRDEITGTEGLIYYSFVAVEPLKADGIPGHVDNKHVDSKNQRYRTFEDASAACAAHAKKERI